MTEKNTLQELQTYFYVTLKKYLTAAFTVHHSVSAYSVSQHDINL